MSRDEIYKIINEIFCSVFDDANLVINDSTTSSDIEDWDSLEQINLVVAIEKKFNIKFSMNEVIEFKNVGEMVDKIMSKVN